MRQSVGDMISGMRTQAEIGELEATTATRMAELPYAGPRAAAVVEALRATARHTQAQATETLTLLHARLDELVASGNLKQTTADNLKLMGPAELAKVMEEQKLLDAQTKKALAESKLIPVQIGDKIHELPASIAAPILQEQENTRRAIQSAEETARRQDARFMMQESRHWERMEREDAERKRAIGVAETKEVAEADAKAAEAHGVIRSSVLPSGAYRLEPAAMVSWTDQYNRNSRGPHIYVDIPVSKDKYFPRLRDVTGLRRLRLPYTTETGQIRASTVYQAAAAKSQPLYEYLQDMYKRLNVDMMDFIEPED